MDMEQLSKSQVVLLTLLVTFVTSIATGIVTVSLMEKAPPAIAQTVNRVVEHTVERIVPIAQSAAASAPAKTVVVKEADQVAQAVAVFSPSVARLYSSDAADPIFLGLGVVIESGVIVTDTSAIGEYSDAVAVLHDGSHARLFVRSRDANNALAYLRVATSTDTTAKPVVWTPAKLAIAHPVLAQRVVVVSGKSVPHVGESIVTSLVPRTSGVDIIETGLADGAILYGSPLIDDSGALVGISSEISRNISASAFVPANVISASAATKNQ